MKVIMFSPGFPDEMPHFTRALAKVGADVFGVGDQPLGALADDVRRCLAGYLHVKSLWEEEKVVAEVRAWIRGKEIDRVECLWEPGMTLAARMREALGVPGLRLKQAQAFRDKELMKQALDRAGVRTPAHTRARTKDECRAAAERFGYPLIIKPIAGAGSADTYPLRGADDLEGAFRLLEHVPEVSVEEFIEGEEYTFDTVSVRGRPQYENVAWYRPTPLVSRLNEWISAQAICLRDIDVPEIVVGRELGYRVLEALEFESGFSHMEWFRTRKGEAVFGEIGGRPPGGRLVHGMNYAGNIDLFVGWAEAVCYGRFSQDARKRTNAAVVFKRAQGQGRIQRIEGLESLLGRYGEHICHIDLLPVGSPRRDWRQVVSGDGWLIARHQDLSTCMEIADRIGTDLRLFAG